MSQLRYGWKTASYLKAECQYRGLPHTGTKKVLIQRLVDAEKLADTK